MALPMTVAAVDTVTTPAAAAPAPSVGNPQWTIQASPNPPGGSQSLLTDVSCPAPASCTAVGTSTTGPAQTTLAEQWDGALWTIQPSPALAGSTSAILYGVACYAASSCTAVGYRSDGTTDTTLIEHWDGVTWSLVASPNVTGATTNMLHGVSCATAGDCVAVGYAAGLAVGTTLVEQWNGIGWSIVPSPSPAGATTSQLVGVSCTAATHCVAVGSSTDSANADSPLIEMWNGITWTIVDSPPTFTPSGGGGSTLAGVSCADASSCTAVGVTSDGTNLLTLIEQWDGRTWTIEPSNNVSGAVLNILVHVSCTAVTNCIAVGFSATATPAVSTLIEQWDGLIWTTVASPNPPGITTGVALVGVSCTPAAGCTAVGAGSPSSTLVEHRAAPPPEGFTPVVPVRICDTRAASAQVAANQCNHDGGRAGTLGNGTMTVKVGGFNGVPNTATAVVLNVTATNTTASSYLTVWPAGEVQPFVSNLNWVAGQTVPNLVEVALDANGSVSIFNFSGAVDLVVDLEGYVDATAPGLYHPLTPTRICDTRALQPGVGANACEHAGGSAGTLGVGAMAVNVAGAGGVPVNATAVVVNVTVTDTTANGYLTVWPDGPPPPVASDVNWVSGQTTPNRVIVPLGPSGKIDVYNSAGTTDVIVDVNGYFSPTPGGSGYHPSAANRITPNRLCDTRTVGPGVVTSVCNDAAHGGPHPLGPNGELTLSVPTGFTAVVVNVTVTDTTAASYLTVFPDPTPGVFQTPPPSSDLNWTPGQTVTNLVVVATGGAHTITFYNHSGTADIVVDLEGLYTTTPT
jgi:hypothetical protein